MITLLPEKKGTFLRASLCDVCNFSCEYCAKDMGMENHTPKCIEAGLLSAEEYCRNLEKLRLMDLKSFPLREENLCFAGILPASPRRQGGCSGSWKLQRTVQNCPSI